MAMVRVAGVLALTLAACAGSSSSGPPAPTMCSMSDRHGTYLIHTDVVSGNCPPIPDSLTIFGVPTQNTTCTVASIAWSNGDCRNDVAYSCLSNGIRVFFVGYTVQEAQDGSVIKGELTTSVSGGCSGTYRITYTRQ